MNDLSKAFGRKNEMIYWGIEENILEALFYLSWSWAC